MKRFLIRLDDASDYMDVARWERMEALLDKFNIKPLVGIIPDNKDPDLTAKYEKNPGFWGLAHKWIEKGWTPAMHGFEHNYVSQSGGMNPVNNKSEFAGLPYEEQERKIKTGYSLLTERGIDVKVFFAPGHTFDKNTLEAIRNATPIRIISDTVANDIYFEDGFYFIPQQSGKVRNLPLKTVTFCYHPNTMREDDFKELEGFLKANGGKAMGVFQGDWKKRELSVIDKSLRKTYFILRKIRSFI